jgi:hypothetical protein
MTLLLATLAVVAASATSVQNPGPRGDDPVVEQNNSEPRAGEFEKNRCDYVSRQPSRQNTIDDYRHYIPFSLVVKPHTRTTGPR